MCYLCLMLYALTLSLMFLLKSLGFLILKQKYPFAHHLNLLLPREKIWCLSTLWFFFLMSEFVYGVHGPNFKSHVHLNKKLPYDPSGWMSNHFSMCGKMALVHKYLCVRVCVCVCVCVCALNLHALMSNTGTVWRKPMGEMCVLW